MDRLPSGKSIFIRYGLTFRTKMVMIPQNYEAITRVNYRTDKKQFTHRQCKNLDIMSKNPGVSSAYVIFFAPFTPAAEQKHNKSRHGFLAKFGAVIEPSLIYSYHNRECGSSCVRPLS